MIKIERIITPSPKQMEFVVEGMRNPFNSWDKSDSYKTHMEDPETLETADFEFFLGDNDMKLMNTLRFAGADHRKFMRQMPLAMRITSNHFFWAEFDTYKISTVRNSCSKMHRIHVEEFTSDNFSHEGIDEVTMEHFEIGLHFETVIKTLEWLRCRFNETQDKKYWRALLELLPMGYNLTANVTMNYENALNMYQARQNHHLDEWKDFCKVLETIPYSWLISGKVGDGYGKDN